MIVSSLTIDCTRAKTQLCELGAGFGTDKTVYHELAHMHRHPYTQVYDMLFSARRNYITSVGEIGILHNASMQMWRKYFPYANLYGFEYDPALIKSAQEMNLDYTAYTHMNVQSQASIDSVVKTLAENHIYFDILIDDSTHQIADQIDVASAMSIQLHDDGVFIIEDIFLNANEQDYVDALKDYYARALFITPTHELENSPGWNNSKLLFLYKE